MMRIPFAFLAVLALVSGVASASIYRWVDTDGRVHYTDKPVQNAEPVNIHTGQPKGAIPLPDTAPAHDPGLTPDQRTQKQADCEQKKKQLATYKDAAKIVETDGLGREHEYNESEKQLLMKKTTQQMQESCGVASLR